MPFDPDTQRALEARVRFYRDLGIHEFYRREAAPSRAPIANEDFSTLTLPVLNQPQDNGAALRTIREDLGDCVRCKLHRLGRKQIVFGVGNPNAELMFVGEGPGAD